MSKKREKVGVIYQIVNKVSKRKYIGSTVRPLRYRTAEHFKALGKKKVHTKEFIDDFVQHGQESFEVEVIEEIVLTGDDLVDKVKILEREQWYLDNWEHEYNENVIAGSRLGSKSTEETKRKLSENLRKRWKDVEYREKMVKTWKEGWRNPKLREKRIENMEKLWESEEYREKQRLSREELNKDPEYILKLGKLSKERWQNEEYREKILPSLNKACKKFRGGKGYFLNIKKNGLEQWVARPRLGKQNYYLGSFRTEVEAKEAVAKFHQEHLEHFDSKLNSDVGVLQ